AVLVGGLGIGVAITFVIDVLDDRMRTPEDLQAELGLPLLATIGSMEAAEHADHDEAAGMETVHMWNEADDAASESFRTIRTVLVMGTADSQRIAVSSSEPG
ncbi:MAG: hypothetical protein ACKOEX_12565, partial [Planctomycetia bacterium]